MSPSNHPAAAFKRFERVLVKPGTCHADFAGQIGVILWCDPIRGRKSDKIPPWGYVVYLPNMDRCWNFGEFDLETQGTFDPESAHLGTRAEISFDLVMSENMAGIEGTYRLPGKFWQVAIFDKEDVLSVQTKFGTWESGITGINFTVPLSQILNRAYAIRALWEVYKLADWTEVRGPDSIMLR